MAEREAYREQSVELRSGKLRLLCGGAGDAAVLLHHSTGSPGWTPFHEELSRRFTVAAPDLPGYGQSPRPEWARDARDLAIVIGRVIERLALEDVTLIGLGFGGFVAAELATQNPSRLATLALVGAAGVRPEHGEILDQMLISHEEYVAAGFRDRAAHDAVFGEKPAAELMQLWDLSREMTARVAWKPYMWSPRLAPLLPDLQVPTLVVHGEQDRVVPPDVGEQYARLIPGARLERMAGAGHLVELEEPARVAELIAGHRAKSLRRTGA